MKKIIILLVLFNFLSCSNHDDFSNEEPKNDDNTPEVSFKETFDNQIFEPNIDTQQVIEIIDAVEAVDGYILFTREAFQNGSKSNLKVYKFDFQFNLKWSILLNDSTESIPTFGGFFESNGEYVAVFSQSVSRGQYFNGEVKAVKFNESGAVIWNRKYYNFRNNNREEVYFSHDMIIPFVNHNGEKRFIIQSDSINNSFLSDKYFNELLIDNEFNVLEEKVIPYPQVGVYPFTQFLYDNLGNKYNYGANLFVIYFYGLPIYTRNALLMKYNKDNEVIYEKEYGTDPIDERFDKILIDNDKIVAIGRYGKESKNFFLRRSIFQLDNNSGSVIWHSLTDSHLLNDELFEIQTTIEYYGKDLIFDNDRNYLALFHESGGVTTLIKINKEGSFLWKYTNDKDTNGNFFQPSKVFTKDEEYIIFGVSNYNKLWVKKIKIE